MDDDEQNFNAESSNSEESKKENAGSQPTNQEVQFSGLGMGLVGSFAGVGGGNFPGVGGGSRHPVPVALSQGISKGLEIYQMKINLRWIFHQLSKQIL